MAVGDCCLILMLAVIPVVLSWCLFWLRLFVYCCYGLVVGEFSVGWVCVFAALLIVMVGFNSWFG